MFLHTNCPRFSGGLLDQQRVVHKYANGNIRQRATLETNQYYELSQDNGVGVWNVRFSVSPIVTPNVADTLSTSIFDGDCPAKINFRTGGVFPPGSPGTWFFSDDGFADSNPTISSIASTWECWDCSTTGFYVWFAIGEIGGSVGAAQIDSPTGTFGNGSPYYQFELISVNFNTPSGYFFQLSRGTDGTGNWQLFRINTIGVDPTTPTDLLGSYTGTLTDENCPIGLDGFDWIDENGSLDFVTDSQLLNFSKPIPTSPTTTTTTAAPTTTTTTAAPTTTTTTKPINVEPRNECDVITIFPMGVFCRTTNPTTTQTYDGVAQLEITGGTPPYTISWDNENHSQTITNLNVGSYSAIVTDFYGDFNVSTTCVLTASTPTSTTTTSTTTLPIYGNLCMILDPSDADLPSTFVDFTYSGYLNGNPYWISNDDEYSMYWNTGTTNVWIISGLTSENVIGYNENPEAPPLNGWTLAGKKGNIFVIEGSCDEIQPLKIEISSNNPTCANSRDGSIVITPYGGIPPYEYSIDGGTTWQTNPIFNNLSVGNYSVQIRDSIGTTQTTLVTLTANQTVTNYVLTLTRTNLTFNVTVSPPLPNGVSITFDLLYDSTFTRSPDFSSATYNGNLVINVDGSPIAENPPSITNTNQPNERCPEIVGEGETQTTTFPYNYHITTTDRTWPTITMTNGTTVNGTILDQITPITPLVKCYEARRTFNGPRLNNVRISGCTPCCTVTAQQLATNIAVIGNFFNP
jgi:hypothetical protein